MGTAAQTYTLAHFANQAYQSSPEVAGWTIIDKSNDAATGFSAVAWKNNMTNEIVIAYRGTDGLSDLPANGAIIGAPISIWSPQFTQGLDFAKQIRDANPGTTISVTGHSLGGAMAQVTSQMFGWSGAGFDPGGAANLVVSSEFKTLATQYGLPESGLCASSEFRNYIMSGSLVSSLTGNHVGALESLTGWIGQLNANAAFASGILLGLAYNFLYLHSMDRIEALLKDMADIEAGRTLDWGGELSEALISLNPELNSLFLTARGLLMRDPLAIDLDGDGIETVGTAAGVLFDHDADGVKTGTGWVVGDDAFVVLDRDGNGLIDSGRELFGVDTVVGADVLGNPLYAKDGFDALASLDSNADSLFDANDADYANVRLWRDLNQDGISQSNELQSLAEAGITAIDLAAHEARKTLAGGNVQTLSAGVAGIGGSAVALDLASNPFYREYPDHLDTTTVADLPDMQGSGSLRDLKEAATQSAMLESQLRALATQGYVNRAAFLGQIETLIVAWADTSAMQTWAQRQAQAAQQTMYLNWNDGPATSAGKHTLANTGAVGMEIPCYDIHIIYQPQGVDRGLLEAENDLLGIGTGDGSSTGTIGTLPGASLSEAERTEQLAKWERANYLIETLERFNGMTFVNLEPDRVTDSTGRDISTRIVSSSGVDTSSGGGIPGAIPVFIPLSNTQFEMLEQSYAALTRSVYDALASQTRLKGYMDSIGLVIDENGVGLDFVAMDTMLADRYANSPQDAFADLVDLARINDKMLMGMGWQPLGRLSAWLETLDGGSVDAYALATELGMTLPTDVTGNDFVFGKRSAEISALGTGNDILFALDGDDNVDGGEGDDYVDGGSGNDWLKGRAGNDTLMGGTGDDMLYGHEDDDELDGGGGNDRLYGDIGSDSLKGEGGDDTLDGGAGDDVLDGGVGNDALSGGTGNDTYLLARGSGIDTIYDYDATDGNVDVVQFADIASTDVTSLERRGSDLIINYGENDQLTITSYFSAREYRVEQFRFSDGMTWDDAAIKAQVITYGDANNNSIAGYNDGGNRIYGLDGNDFLLKGGGLDDWIDGGNGDDTLYGLAGNDLLIGAEGDDWLVDETGDDSLLGGAGNDYLSAGAGNDTLEGGVGNDTLYGGSGNDIYLFAKGSGVDVVYENDITAGNGDVAHFVDVASIEVTALERQNSDLIIRYGTSDQLTVKYYFDGSAFRLEGFQFSDGVTWDDAAVKARTATLGDAGNNTITGYSDNSNLIYGLGGNDTLNGGLKNDILDGGTGNDYLSGGAGNDTYLFAIGAGTDKIYDYDTTAGNTDVVQFDGVASTEVMALERQNNDLVLKYGVNDQLTVSGYFSSDYFEIEQFRFGDGVVWDEAAIRAKVVTLGDANGNLISGYNDGENRIYGLGGNDSLYGGALDDTLDGGVGNDALSGRAGNDTLIGGTGNDTLNGESGNDTYLFAKGDGADRITDNDNTAGNLDIARFADVASSEVLALERQGNDLVLKYGASDQVTVASYFSGSAYRVEQFQFSDGVIWNDAAIKAQAITLGDANGNSITGYSDGSNRIYGLGGNDYLYGGALGDLLDGGSGSDYLNGGAGNDTYVFSLGSGIDKISESDTTAGNIDVARFSDVASSGVTALERRGNDLVLKYGTNDQLTVGSYFVSAGYRIEQFQFGDGVTWDDTAIKARVLTMGDANGNAIYGYDDGGNRIYGLDGNDTLYGGALNDLLEGGNGDDWLYGKAGNDTLNGGAGNDSLRGELGNDVYQFGRGGGIDNIYDADTTPGNVDVASFASDIAVDQLWFQRVGNNLDVSIIGTADKLTIQSWYLGAAYHVEQFMTADYYTLLDSQVENLVQAMAAFSPPAAGETTLPPAYQTALAPVIAANWQ